MEITGIIIAFISGAFACSIGSVWVFIACATTCLIGVISNNPAVSAFAFSPLLNPATTFMAAACAASYATWRGMPTNVGDPMALLKKPDVLLVGGVAGAAGYIVNYLFGLLKLPQFDTISATVIAVPIICKLIFEKSLFNQVPDDIKAMGGRRSHLHSRCYYEGWRRGSVKTLVGACYGCFMAMAIFCLVNIGVDISLAGLIGFGFGGFLLLLPKVPGNHFVGVSVAAALNLLAKDASFYTSANIYTIMFWGIGIGTLSMYVVDLITDLWSNYGYTCIDGVASSITITTLFISLVVGIAGITTVWLPVVVFLICTVWGIVQDLKWNSYSAHSARASSGAEARS